VVAGLASLILVASLADDAELVWVIRRHSLPRRDELRATAGLQDVAVNVTVDDVITLPGASPPAQLASATARGHGRSSFVLLSLGLSVNVP
jgi:hypothetical protein